MRASRTVAVRGDSLIRPIQIFIFAPKRAWGLPGVALPYQSKTTRSLLAGRGAISLFLFKPRCRVGLNRGPFACQFFKNVEFYYCLETPGIIFHAIFYPILPIPIGNSVTNQTATFILPKETRHGLLLFIKEDDWSTEGSKAT